MIFEGSYPYVHGGVSSWAHNNIRSMPDVEFSLWCIGAREKDRGKFRYDLPENVTSVTEIFLDAALKVRTTHREQKQCERYLKKNRRRYETARGFLTGEHDDWDGLFSMFQRDGINPAALLYSEQFTQYLIGVCRTKYTYVPFTDFFYTVRSMVLPVLYLISQKVPEADLYHATSTGYGGLLGSLAAWLYKKPMVVTEHGIYTREREEELLRAEWVQAVFREQWVRLFYRLSGCAYHYASRVTSLFRGAGEIQKELGCPEEKLMVIPNGIRYDRFEKIPFREGGGPLTIGAVVRIAPIKDIRTLIYAFAEVKEKIPDARLYILGDTDDEEYARGCRALVRQLCIKDIYFTGMVDVMAYMPKFDFTVLSSISEGQPLAVLESFAAGRPAVVTNVGCCRELIEGTGSDSFGPAGIVVPPMHKERLAGAMIAMGRDAAMRRRMAVAARKRAGTYYRLSMSMKRYRELYDELAGGRQEQVNGTGNNGGGNWQVSDLN